MEEISRKPESRWEDNIRLDLRELGWKFWTEQDRDDCQVLD